MTSFKKFLAPLTAVALVAVMAVSLLSQQRPASANGEVAQVTAFTTTAPVQLAGLVETWTIGFTTSANGDLLTTNTIVTTFPAGFGLPPVPVCVAVTGFSVGATLACVGFNQVVTATLTGTVADATAVTFTIAGITNPTAQTFAIGLGPSVVTDGSTTFRPSLVALTIWSPAVTAPIQAIGLVETYTATFTSSSTGNLAVAGTVTVVFPAGFTVPTAPTCTFPVGFAGATATCVGTPSATVPTVVATLTGGTLAVRTVGSMAITGITNPAAATVFAVGTTAGSIATSADVTARGNGAAMTVWTTTATKNPATGTADGAGSVTVTFTSSAAAVTGATGTTSPVLTVSTDVGTIPTVLSGAQGQTFTASLTGATQATSGVAANSGGAAAPLVAVIKAPTTAGTSTVLLRATPVNGGAAVLLGSTQITWTAATALAGAAATVTVVPAADNVGNATAQNTVVTARDAAGTLVLNGTVVTATTSNGTFTTCPGGTTGSGVCAGTIQALGAVTLGITGAGVSGTQTISVTVGTVTSTATVTLTGLASTLELSGRRSNSASSLIAKAVVRNTDSSTTDQDELIVAGIAKDAAGGVLGSGNVTFTVTGPAGNTVVVVTANESLSPVAGTACSVSGTGTTSCTDAIEARAAGASTPSHAFAYIDIDSLAGEPIGTYTVTGSIVGVANATIFGTMTFTLVKAPATLTMTDPGTIGLGESKAVTITCKNADDTACPSGTLIAVNVSSSNLLAQNASTGSAGSSIADIRTTDAGTATVNLIGVTAGTTQIVINTSTITALKSVTVGTGPAVVVTAPGAFVGTVSATGTSIVTFTGTLAQLAATAAEAKAITVAATVGGKFVTHVVGAPAFVNAEFAAAFATGLTSQGLIIVK